MMNGDIDVVARAAADRYLALEMDWLDWDRRREAALAEAERCRLHQTDIEENVQRCYATAALFGFDLQTMIRERTTLAMPRPRDLEFPLPVPQKIPTVKEFVLKTAQDAFPDRVRASEVRKALLEQLGMEVHEKTVGMTMYRLLKEGKLTRSGIDWFFNPDQGKPQSNGSNGLTDDQREIAELLDGEQN